MLRLIVIAAAALAVLASYGATYWAGHRAGSAGVEARVAREVAAERQRQAEAGNAALDTARRQAEETETENLALQKQVDAYEAELAQRAIVAPPAECKCDANATISPEDARRLDAIR